MFSFAPVQSVLKALRLLTEVNRCSVATVGELHRRTGMPKPTIVRLLETLIKAGYVTRDERMRGYLVTSQVAHLSSGFHGAPMVIEAARPWATALTRQIKWPCAVCLLDYDAVMVRFSTIPDSPISPFHATLGYRLNLGGRALGRAYLAFCPDEERDVLRVAMRASDEPENNSLSDEDVERMIAQARWRGYTERDPAAEPRNSATIAVPIKLGERVLATFGVTFFRAAVPNPDDKAKIIHPLKKAAANIEAQLEALSQSMGVAFQGEK